MEELLRTIPKFLHRMEGEDRSIEAIVFAAWRRVVDDNVAGNVVPLRIVRGRLTAAVANETWRRQVADLGPALADRLNAAVGERLVEYVEFRVDEDSVRRGRKSIRSAGVSDLELRKLVEAQVTPDLTAAASSISDPELRRRFLAAAGSSLARRAGKIGE